MHRSAGLCIRDHTSHAHFFHVSKTEPALGFVDPFSPFWKKRFLISFSLSISLFLIKPDNFAKPLRRSTGHADARKREGRRERAVAKTTRPYVHLKSENWKGNGAQNGDINENDGKGGNKNEKRNQKNFSSISSNSLKSPKRVPFWTRALQAILPNI